MEPKHSTAEYYPAFDYLRIILASAVALAHSGFPIWEHTGNYSVQIFFAMSGWLIGGILLRSNPTDLPRFYFNRAARIWIPYFVSIALLISASLLKETITSKWIEIFFYDVTFTYNFFGTPQLAQYGREMPLEGTGSHFWSICAEEQFYLFSPFLITIPTRFGRSIGFWCFIAALALLNPYTDSFGSISLGVLASVVRLRIGDWHSTNRASAVLATLAVIGFSMTYFNLIPYRLGAALSAVSIVLLLAQRGSPTKLSQFLGGVSYPMYLNHWVGIFVANYIFARIGLRGTLYSELASVVIAGVIAAVLFLCVDRTVKLYRDQYFTAARGRAIAISGFALFTAGVIGGITIMH